MTTPEQKNALVLQVLKEARKPITANEIRYQISPCEWKTEDRRIPSNGIICIVLRRINAVRHPGGKYTAPVLE